MNGKYLNYKKQWKEPVQYVMFLCTFSTLEKANADVISLVQQTNYDIVKWTEQGQEMV
jgi:hypothetical protein